MSIGSLQNQRDIVLDAVRSQNKIILSKILKEFPEVLNAVDEFGKTPLILAAAEGYTEIGRFLINLGADTNIQDKVGGRSALMWAAWGGRTDFVKLLVDPSLVEGTLSLDLVDSYDGRTALMYAASSGNFETLRVLIDTGANINIQQKSDGRTALITSVIEGQLETMQSLLAAGADVNISDTIECKTPVVWAASKGSFDALQLLVDGGARLALTDKWGYSALHYGVQTDSWAVVRGLLFFHRHRLVSDLDLNHLCSNGMSPLHLACLHGMRRNRFAVALTRQGADPWLRGASGQTPLDIAAVMAGGMPGGAWSDGLVDNVVNAWKKRVVLIVSIAQASGDNSFKKLYRDHRDVWRYIVTFL